MEKVKQICNLCDYASSQSSRLRSHLITHTGDKPNEESHTGEKPYMRFMWFIFQSCVFICFDATEATKNASISANLKVSPRYGDHMLAQFWNKRKNISMNSRFFYFFNMCQSEQLCCCTVSLFSSLEFNSISFDFRGLLTNILRDL